MIHSDILRGAYRQFGGVHSVILGGAFRQIVGMVCALSRCCQFGDVAQFAVVDQVVIGAVGFVGAELFDVDDAEFFEVADGSLCMYKGFVAL